MEILLTDIDTKNYCLDIEELLSFPDKGVGLSAEVMATFRIRRQQEDVYSLRGELKAQVVTSCARCGNDAQLSIEQNFSYQFLMEAEPDLGAEYECNDEDCELLYLTAPVIETSEILSEQLLLALPLDIKCGDDCKGLCDQCGINLNTKQCTCGEINRDSPFAILKDLQKN